jgi:ABC-2 type transport system permease protein
MNPAFRKLARSEASLFLRTPVAVTWTALLPVVALIALGSVPAIREDSASLHGISYLDAYLPILMAFSLCMSAVNLLPPTLALYREKGILRRLSTTPVPPSWLLGAQAFIFAGVGLVVSVLLLAVGIAFGVPVPDQLPGFVLSLILIALSTLGIGVLVAALASTGKAANAVAMALFFPLMFFAGLWVPRAQMPGLLRTISDYSPLGAGVHSLQDSIAGHWPTGQSLLVMLAWAVVTGALANRFFRWE